MVGPSSSHTAGACQIAYIAKIILGKDITKATIYLHGSFAETYKGHGTDKAIVAGLLGFKPDDERLRDSFSFAKETGLNYKIKTCDLGIDYHPNTVLLKLENSDKEKMELIGSSIGGGNIKIKEIDGFEADFNGDFPTLIIFHKDRMGIISLITKTIADYKLNIGTMKVSKDAQTRKVLTWIEVNENIPLTLQNELERIDGIRKVRLLNV